MHLSSMKSTNHWLAFSIPHETIVDTLRSKKMEYYPYGIRTAEPNPLESFSREMGRNSLKYQKIYRLDVAGKIAKKSSGTSVRSSSPLENDL